MQQEQQQQQNTITLPHIFGSGYLLLPCCWWGRKKEKHPRTHSAAYNRLIRARIAGLAYVFFIFNSLSKCVAAGHVPRSALCLSLAAGTQMQ